MKVINSMQTYFLKKLLEEVENPTLIESPDLEQNNVTDSEQSISMSRAFQWTAALCICELFRAVSYSIMFGVIIRTGIRSVNALNGTLYEKILSKCSNNGTDKKSSLLQPTNLFANDFSKVFHMIYMLPLMIGSPIIILVTIAYSIHLIGQSALVGVILFILIFGLQFYITKRQARLRDQLMTQADNRISLVTQLMKDIRTVKFNAWEKAIQKDISCKQQLSQSSVSLHIIHACVSHPILARFTLR